MNAALGYVADRDIKHFDAPHDPLVGELALTQKLAKCAEPLVLYFGILATQRCFTASNECFEPLTPILKFGPPGLKETCPLSQLGQLAFHNRIAPWSTASTTLPMSRMLSVSA